MNTRRICSLLSLAGLLAGSSMATATPADTIGIAPLPPVYKFYVGTSMEGPMLSGASIDHPGSPSSGTLRFSYFFNLGTTFNFNLSRHFGVFTGFDLKNIGFIENIDDRTIKRRTYNLGVPVGIKIGDMAIKHPYLFLGGGLDLPINYKEKSFPSSGRFHKTKFNEWFSNRTPHLMPYVFAGVALKHGLTLKVQYYPNNFLNPDFTDNNVPRKKPYANYNVHLFALTVGMNVPTGKRHKRDIIKVKISDLHTSYTAR